MRFFGLSVVVAALAVTACGGGDKTAAKTDSGTVAPPTPATTTAMKPVTGQTVVVKMIGDATGYKFDPAEVTIKQGDGIKFIMVSGGPHNVAFDPATITDATAKAQLTANMTEPVMELSGKYLVAPNEEYVLSFAGVPAGTYDFHCTPHLAMNMKGKVTVQ